MNAKNVDLSRYFEAEQRVERARNHLVEMRKKLAAEEQLAIEKLHGVKVGSIVHVRVRGHHLKLVEAKVTRVEALGDIYTPPWVTGCLKRKDGSWRAQERAFFRAWSLP